MLWRSPPQAFLTRVQTRSDKWARAAAPKPKSRSWEDEWLANYQPPVTTPNRFVLAATSVLSFCLAVYSAWHIRH